MTWRPGACTPRCSRRGDPTASAPASLPATLAGSLIRSRNMAAPAVVSLTGRDRRLGDEVDALGNAARIREDAVERRDHVGVHRPRRSDRSDHVRYLRVEEADEPG